MYYCCLRPIRHDEGTYWTWSPSTWGPHPTCVFPRFKGRYAVQCEIRCAKGKPEYLSKPLSPPTLIPGGLYHTSKDKIHPRCQVLLWGDTKSSHFTCSFTSWHPGSCAGIKYRKPQTRQPPAISIYAWERQATFYSVCMYVCVCVCVLWNSLTRVLVRNVENFLHRAPKSACQLHS